jgi:thiamine biosynthesis protein ThiI
MFEADNLKLKESSDLFLNEGSYFTMDYWVVSCSEKISESNHVEKQSFNKLVENIKKQMPYCHVKTDMDKIWISENIESQKLKNIFGIGTYSYCKCCSIDDLNEYFIEYCKELNLESLQSFAHHVKLRGSHSFSSQDKEKELSDLIRRHYPYLKIDFDNPEKEIFVEIINNDCYLFTGNIAGPGGIPTGVKGYLLALISDRINSAVASYIMMKRGYNIIPVYIDMDPYNEKRKNRAYKVVDSLRKYQPDLELKVIKDYPFYSKKTLKQNNTNKNLLPFKNHLYIAIEDLANKNKVKGIVTGDTINQIDSQTPNNFYLLDGATTLPVYRPLDK